MARLLAIAWMCVLGCSRPSGNGASEDFAQFFDVTPPPHWQVLRMPGVVIFASPPSDAGDPFREMISIVLMGQVQPDPTAALNALVGTLRGQSQAYEELGQGQATVAGRAAAYVDYTTMQGGTTIRERAYVVPTPDRVFVLTLTASIASFGDSLPVMERVLQSFRLKE